MRLCVTSMYLCGFLGLETLKALRLLLCECLGIPHVTLTWGPEAGCGCVLWGMWLTRPLSCDCLGDCEDLRWSECTEIGSLYLGVCLESKRQDHDRLRVFSSPRLSVND